MFVVSGDVVEPGEANSLGANEGSHSLRVFAEAERSTLAHHDCVDGGVHLGIDEGDVVKQVNAPIPDRFNWSWATAEDSCDLHARRRWMIQI